MIELSVVVPVYNEADNILSLCRQVGQALDGVVQYELVLVDDGSTDGSPAVLQQAMAEQPRLVVLFHPANAGQSAALCTGAAAARGELMATLDGDLQNDPADIPKLLTVYRDSARPVLVAGNRVNRRDTWVRRVSSRIANGVRSWLLKDQCPDTGCSLKLFRRADFLLLPQFDHMHRFLPALFAAQGIGIQNVPVNHRPRAAGESKYGVGNRLWVGIADLFGVRWLIRRKFRISASQRHSIQPSERDDS
ncbi:MAG: glycosyltransferase [Xanthomonadales bacterium]|nr:glycosyltransferase [Xanthomonadales bacterium]